MTRPARRSLAAVTAVMLFAAFMHLHQLTTFPPGLDPDAALDGLEALKILRYGLFPFYVLNNSNADPLFIYSQAVLTLGLGAKVLTLRLPSVFGGLLGFAMLYTGLAEIGRRGWGATARRRIALLAVTGLASSEVLAFIHRIGERFAIQPLFQMAALWSLLRALRTGERKFWIAGGVLAGLTQYTYSAARMIPVVLFAALVLELPAKWWKDRSFLRGLAAYLSAALLVLLPQIVFYSRYPGLLLARANQTSLAQNPLFQELGLRGVILDKVAKYWEALGAHWLGQYNQIQEPLFPMLFAWGFVIGLVVCLLFLRRRMSLILLFGLILMLLPEMVAGDRDYPHELRAVGAYPFIAGIAGLGLGGVWRLTRSRLKVESLTGALIAIAIGLTLSTQAADFFGTNEGVLRWSGNAWLRRVDVGTAEFVNHRPANILLPLSNYSHTVVKYLTADRAVEIHSAVDASGELLPAIRNMPSVTALLPFENNARPWKGDPTHWVLFAGDKVYLLPPLPEMETILPSLRAGEIVYDRAGIVQVGRVTELDAKILSIFQTHRPQITSGACFEHGLCLAGVSFDNASLTPGGSVLAELFWTASGQAPDDYIVFVHVLDRNGAVVGGADDYPLHHGYRTYEWRRGEYIISTHRLALPADLPPGAYAVEIGLYSLPIAERLGVLDEKGKVADDRVYLEVLRISQPAVALPEKIESAHVVFGDELELVGYRLDSAAGRGTPLEMTLWWRGLRPASQKWTAFFHVTPAGDNRKIVAQLDRPPTNGSYPPTLWQAGEVVEDHILIDVPPNVVPGDYDLWAGLYSPATFERARISSAPNAIEENRTLLFEFQIK